MSTSASCRATRSYCDFLTRMSTHSLRPREMALGYQPCSESRAYRMSNSSRGDLSVSDNDLPDAADPTTTDRSDRRDCRCVKSQEPQWRAVGDRAGDCADS